MKNFNFYLYLLLIIGVSVACQEKKQESKAVNSLTENTNANNLLNNYSGIFQAILKSDSAMARGVNIGNNFDDIKETVLPAETQPNEGKSFTEYFDGDLNFADITYTKNQANKVETISIDVYIETAETTNSLITEFKSYFDTKYGKGTIKDKTESWLLKDGVNQVTLENVSTAKDPGLKVVFSAINSKAIQ